MAKALKRGTVLIAKKKCCKSRPRCKRCAVTLERLRAGGYVERVEARRYVVVEVVPKRELKEARRK